MKIHSTASGLPMAGAPDPVGNGRAPSGLRPSALVPLALVLCGLAGGSESRAATLSEPETVFYGRIINRMSGQTYVLSEGTLNWRIRRSNGTLVTLTGQ